MSLFQTVHGGAWLSCPATGLGGEEGKEAHYPHGKTGLLATTGPEWGRAKGGPPILT